MVDLAKLDELIARVERPISGTLVDALLAQTAIPEPKGLRCGSCDLGFGTRGMDRCSECAGTGSVFIVGGDRFPNTEQGYVAAVLAMLRALRESSEKGR